MKTETTHRLVGATLAVVLLAAAAFFWTQEGEEQSMGLLTAALGLVALVTRSPLERRRQEDDDELPPGAGGAAGLLLLALALVPLLEGCGAGALAMQADLVALGGIAAAEADEAIVAARAADLDAVVERAELSCGEGQCDEARAEAFRAELERREARWQPVMECRAPIVEALRSWADGIETAHAAGTEEIGLALLLRLGLRFLGAYAALDRCIEATGVSFDLPGLPPQLVALGGAS